MDGQKKRLQILGSIPNRAPLWVCKSLKNTESAVLDLTPLKMLPIPQQVHLLTSNQSNFEAPASSGLKAEARGQV